MTDITKAMEQNHYFTTHTFVCGYRAAAVEQVFDASIWESEALAWPVFAEVDAVLGNKASYSLTDSVTGFALRSNDDERPWGNGVIAASAQGVSGEVVEPADLIDDGMSLDDLIDENATFLLRFHYTDPMPGIEEDYVAINSTVIFERDADDRVVKVIFDGMADVSMSDFRCIVTDSDRD